MKSRKQLSHVELQSECIRQLSNYFKPDMKMIKKRIEDLIQRCGGGGWGKEGLAGLCSAGDPLALWKRIGGRGAGGLVWPDSLVFSLILSSPD